MANKLFEALQKKGEVDVAELEYSDGKRTFFNRALYRLNPAVVKLAPVRFSPRDYDVVCIGVPVWGGRPSGAVTKYLMTCDSLAGKKVVCFYVYSIESSVKSCSKYVRKLIKKKGCNAIIDMFVPWQDVHNEVFLQNVITETIAKIG